MMAGDRLEIVIIGSSGIGLGISWAVTDSFSELLVRLLLLLLPSLRRCLIIRH